MCGIAGIYKFENDLVRYEELKRMSDAIHHRGPDGEGQWLNANATVGLAHRRLSIIDLSENGKQPMHYGEERYTIVFNGEIYNYVELKEQLLQKGYAFKSDSDTEVLMALYDLKKEKCLEDLDGMFAFVIWDKKEKILFCARDRFGEKPFFYNYEKGKSFAFASEMKALFALGIPKEMDPQMMFNYLNDHYIISDPSDRSKTFYTGIKRLEQAHYLIIKENGELLKKQYWTIDHQNTNTEISFEEACDKFKTLFYQSISRRLRSDVPVGSSLSGGLDSSSIVCGISELTKGKHLSQSSFSARFSDFNKDEGKYIDYVIDKTGINANYVWPDEAGFLADFKNLCYHQEEPFPSASIYAQYTVMKLAKEKGVTVLLDGQGADESLAGYEFYFNTFLKELHLAKHPSFENQRNKLLGMHERFLADEYKGIGGSQKNKTLGNSVKDLVRPAYRFINPAKYKAIDTRSYSRIRQETLFNKGFLDQFNENDTYRMDGTFLKLNDHLKNSFFVNNLEDLLRFSDRNSMAHSREVRLPFLNHELVQFIFSLPASYKVNDGWSKYVLRKSMEGVLPDEITWRKDKIGYEPPQKKWMEHPAMKEQINDFRSDLVKDKILNAEAELTKDQEFAVLNVGYFKP